MDAATKSVVSGMTKVLAVAMIALVLQLSDSQVHAQGSNCTSTLNGLGVCAPFAVPGASNMNPSADCCAAILSADHDCYCNTLRIAAQLPSHCNLPPLSCTVN